MSVLSVWLWCHTSVTPTSDRLQIDQILTKDEMYYFRWVCCQSASGLVSVTVVSYLGHTNFRPTPNRPILGHIHNVSFSFLLLSVCCWSAVGLVGVTEVSYLRRPTSGRVQTDRFLAIDVMFLFRSVCCRPCRCD